MTAASIVTADSQYALTVEPTPSGGATTGVVNVTIAAGSAPVRRCRLNR